MRVENGYKRIVEVIREAVRREGVIREEKGYKRRDEAPREGVIREKQML